MHVVVRRWGNAPTVGDAVANRSQEVQEILRSVPGFVAYYALRDGDEVTTITVCEDEAGTRESTRRAGEWVRQTLTGDMPGAPEIIEGNAFLHF